MVHKAVRLACGNEHGFGDVYFPDIPGAMGFGQSVFDPKYPNAKVLRAEAKKAGWGRIGNEDYCPDCMQTEASA